VFIRIRSRPADAVEADQQDQVGRREDGMDQISTRMLVLLGVGALTMYVAYHHPGLGVAIGVGVIVMALLHELLAK
jgi:Flp pilus assembly protein TadB